MEIGERAKVERRKVAADVSPASAAGTAGKEKALVCDIKKGPNTVKKGLVRVVDWFG